jgi:hypothetical protein
MKSQHHFEIQCEIEPREAAQIRTLIADLDRIVQVLTCDIATEEERTRVFDRSDAMYAILARTLAARRDNLRGTMLRLNSGSRQSKPACSSQLRPSAPHL